MKAEQSNARNLVPRLPQGAGSNLKSYSPTQLHFLMRLPGTQVLMLTSFADDEALYASIMAGEAGYVLKQIRGGELVRGIRAVGAGQSLLDPLVTRSVLERLRKGKHLVTDEKLALLSPQEERVLALVAQGKTNSEIGQELYLAEKTVKNYVSSILSKLDVGRRSEAAAYLARRTTTPGTQAGA